MVRTVVNQPSNKSSKSDRYIRGIFSKDQRVIFIIEFEDTFLVFFERFIKFLGDRVFSTRYELVGPRAVDSLKWVPNVNNSEHRGFLFFSVGCFHV